MSKGLYAAAFFGVFLIAGAVSNGGKTTRDTELALEQFRTAGKHTEAHKDCWHYVHDSNPDAVMRKILPKLRYCERIKLIAPDGGSAVFDPRDNPYLRNLLKLN